MERGREGEREREIIGRTSMNYHPGNAFLSFLGLLG